MIKNIHEAIDYLNKQILNPSKGLPEEIFLFASRITPMVNVDLLIKDENGRTLLSWRDDEFCRKGWHIPGGIVRYKEKMETRIQKVAEIEIGATVKFDPFPIAINQMIGENRTRGHFISILYKGYLSHEKLQNRPEMSVKQSGYLQWHYYCPDDLIKVHEIYRKMI